jgi:hypothetical protein
MTGVVRPRGAWEAADFGFALTRSWHRPVWTAWLVAVAPVWWAVYAGVTWAAGPWVAFLVLWWLRPLFSRLPLLVLSRALFGEVASARRVLREAPRLWLRSAAGDLTVRRLHVARSFALPVHQLEGLPRRERRRRLAVLRQDRWPTAIALTMICALMELCLFLAALTLPPVLTPEGFGVDWQAYRKGLFSDEGASGWYLGVLGACAFLAVSVVEPFYVGGGFGLYLDRRTHLEGWDVELAFRRLARRLRAGGRRRGAGMAAALLAALIAGLAGGGGAAAAEARTAEPPVAEGAAGVAGAAEAPAVAAAAAERDPAAVAREVLAHPDFTTRRRVEVWELRADLFGSARSPSQDPQLPIGFLATLLEVLMWTLALALLAVLVVAVVRLVRLGSRRRRRGGVGEPPAALFGLDLAPESLPDDVPATAREFFAAGRAAQALGLLYRGALARLARRGDVSASWTEEECVRHLAGRLEAAGGAWFGGLAAAWQAAAYAHRAPDAERFAALCSGWSRHLEGAG